MKAVIVIDMLEDFFREGPLRAARSELCSHINTLTERKAPVVWVRQEFRKDLSDAFLVMRQRSIRKTIIGTRGCRVLPELKRTAADHEIVKKRYSAFHGTQLESLLSTLGISELVLAGVNTHACVRTTAIDAYQRDLEVSIVEECVASYDEEHHDVTLRYLNRSIAKVVGLEAVF